MTSTRKRGPLSTRQTTAITEAMSRSPSYDELSLPNNSLEGTHSGNAGSLGADNKRVKTTRKFRIWASAALLWFSTRLSPGLVFIWMIGFLVVVVVFFDLSSKSSFLLTLVTQSSRLDALEPLFLCDMESLNDNGSGVITSRSSISNLGEHGSLHHSALVTWPLASFDPNHSTEENYSIADTHNAISSHFIGDFSSLRPRLDYTYHSVYSPARQRLQDAILTCVLNNAQQTCQPRSGQQQYVIFTAGTMGAGKTYTLKWMAQQKLFPIDSFVRVDPDQLRQMLPEFHYFVQHDASQAGDRTRKEAGMMSELLTLAALEDGRSVIVDGSLRDGEWYENYFTYLRHQYPGIKLAIFHVTAPREAILQHAVNRAQITGRVVPVALLEQTMIQVPASVKRLKGKADIFAEFHNAPNTEGIQLIHPPAMKWNDFEKLWVVPLCRAG